MKLWEEWVQMEGKVVESGTNNKHNNKMLASY